MVYIRGELVLSLKRSRGRAPILAKKPIKAKGSERTSIRFSHRPEESRHVTPPASPEMAAPGGRTAADRPEGPASRTRNDGRRRAGILRSVELSARPWRSADDPDRDHQRTA